MKKILFLIVFLLCNATFWGQNTISGTLINQKHQKIENANIILMALPDSTLVKGAISNNKGIFTLNYTPEKEKKYIIKITHIEYQDQILRVTSDQLGEIILLEATKELDEVVIKASKPIFKQKGTSIITNVATSTLRDLPTTESLLKFLPSITSSYGEIKVIGKGRPIYYINNRKMRNPAELQSIRPSDIETIEVETEPGAEYDNQVNAVIKITLKKKQGDGMSGRVGSQYTLKKGTQIIGVGDMNYRKGNTDIFSTILYVRDIKTKISVEETFSIFSSNPIYEIYSDKEDVSSGNFFYTGLGIAHEFSKKHSLGASVKHSKEIDSETLSDQKNTLPSFSLLNKNFNLQNHSNTYVNTYYEVPLSENIKMQTDIDYTYSFSSIKNKIDEKQSNTPSLKRTIHNHSEASYHWWEAQSHFYHQLQKASLSYGAEFSTLYRYDDYRSPDILSDNYVENKELRSSVFVSLTQPFDEISLKLGVRYEFSDFQYLENHIKNNVKSRMYRNLLPNASVSFPWNQTRWSVSYARKIQRPAFYQLSDYSSYLSQYLYNRGNPYVTPSLTDEFGVLTSYKKIALSVRYNYVQDAILEHFAPFKANPSVIEKSIKNFNSMHNIDLSATAYHQVGIWQPKLSVSVFKQFFTDKLTDYAYNKPIFNVSLYNQIMPSPSWIITAEVDFTSNGHKSNTYNESFFTTQLVVQKFLLHRSLMAALIFSDIFNTTPFGKTFENKYIRNYKKENLNNQFISFGFIYSFNPTQSKYKGGKKSQEDKNRL